MDTERILGVRISGKTLSEIIDDSLAAVARRGPAVIFACANPHSLTMVKTDSVFRSALHRASHIVADGIGVTLVAKLLGLTIGPRITGSDYYLSLMRALQERGAGRVFFFGSSQHVLDLIAFRFRTDFPSLTLCGMVSPPFDSWTEQDNRAMVDTINSSRPDVLWVGMTAPKQEKWVEANRRRLHVPVIGSIGAVFDFYAGTHPRAPEWICQVGLEWAYRFILEPRRLWRRNIVSPPKFVWLVLRQHVLHLK